MAEGRTLASPATIGRLVMRGERAVCFPTAARRGGGNNAVVRATKKRSWGPTLLSAPDTGHESIAVAYLAAPGRGPSFSCHYRPGPGVGLIVDWARVAAIEEASLGRILVRTTLQVVKHFQRSGQTCGSAGRRRSFPW